MNLFPIHLPNFFSGNQDTFIGNLGNKIGHQFQVIRNNPWTLGASVFVLNFGFLYVAEKISSRFDFFKNQHIQTAISYTFKAVFMGGAIAIVDSLLSLKIKKELLVLSVITTIALKVLWQSNLPVKPKQKSDLPIAPFVKKIPPAKNENSINPPTKNPEPVQNPQPSNNKELAVSNVDAKTDTKGNDPKTPNSSEQILDDRRIPQPQTPGTPEYKSEEVISDVVPMLETGVIGDDPFGDVMQTADLKAKNENLGN